MNKLGLIIILCVGGFYLNSQTYFQGGIYDDTNWTFENSPYIITGDVVLFPNNILTIEPGVEIKFDEYYTLEIRGVLNSFGTNDSGIIFTSNMNNPTKGDWNALILKSDFGAQANFEYCKFLFADYAFILECCDEEGSVLFMNCFFDNNNVAIHGYTGFEVEITNCEFTNNNWGITLGSKIIKNSLFHDNEYGIHSGEDIDIRNSVFQENDIGIFGGRGLIDSCIIENNNIGIMSIHQGFELRENQIQNNEIGIQLTSYEGEYAVVRNNKICDNFLYNVENLDEINKDLTENCWCLSDSALIEEKIYDGYDNIHIGLFNFDIYDDSCDIVLESVIKFDPVGMGEQNRINSFRVYPNPFSSSTTIEYALSSSHLVTLSIFNHFGELVHQFQDYQQPGKQQIRWDAGGQPAGIYFYRLNAGEQIATGKLVLMK